MDIAGNKAARPGLMTGLGNICAGLAAIAVVLSVLLVLAEIVARWVFNGSTLISVEYSSYLLIVTTFLGLAYTQRTGQMIQVDVVYGALSPRRKAWADALRHSVALVYGAIAVWYVADFTWRSYTLGQVAPTLTRTPLYLPQLFMVIGMALLALEWLRGTVAAWARVFGASAETKE